MSENKFLRKLQPGTTLLMSVKLICSVFALILIHGCNQNTPAPATPPKTAEVPEPAKKGEVKPPAIPGAKTFERDGVTAQIASWDETQAFIARQKGKIVVVDLWSTWCEPCLREFPQLVALQKKYPEKVVCVSFNLNYDGSKNSPPESNSEELMEFFSKQKADIVNIISSTPDEKIYESIKLAAIPAAYVYGTDGKLKKRFDNETLEYGQEGFTYKKHIVPLIDELLQTTQKQE